MTMEEEFAHQGKMTGQEVLDEYARTGFDPRYAEHFWEKYCSLYDTAAKEEWPDGDESDYALSTTKEGMPWYILYKEIGHPEDWCKQAWEFGAYEHGRVDTLEDVVECLQRAFFEHWRKDPNGATEELKRQCAFIGPRYGKSEVFMRFFYEWVKDMSGGKELLSICEDLEHSYRLAIDAGKGDDFAHYYAERCNEYCDSATGWHLAEQRERFLKEGRDEDYFRTYQWKFGQEFQDHGAPDRYPAWWEQKVDAYLKGWDYARQHGLDSRFADLYENASHSYDVVGPNADEKALEKALEGYRRGE